MKTAKASKISLKNSVLIAAKAALMEGILKADEKDVRAWLMQKHGAHIPKDQREKLIKDAAEDLLRKNQVELKKKKALEQKREEDKKNDKKEELKKDDKTLKAEKQEAEADQENDNDFDLEFDENNLNEDLVEQPEYAHDDDALGIDPDDFEEIGHSIEVLEEADIHALQEELLDDIQGFSSIGDQAAMLFVVSQMDVGNTAFRTAAAVHLDQFVNDPGLAQEDKLLAYAGAEALRDPSNAIFDIGGPVEEAPAMSHFSLKQNLSDEKFADLQDDVILNADAPTHEVVAPGVDAQDAKALLLGQFNQNEEMTESLSQLNHAANFTPADPAVLAANAQPQPIYQAQKKPRSPFDVPLAPKPPTDEIYGKTS